MQKTQYSRRKKAFSINNKRILIILVCERESEQKCAQTKLFLFNQNALPSSKCVQNAEQTGEKIVTV